MRFVPKYNYSIDSKKEIEMSPLKNIFESKNSGISKFQNHSPEKNFKSSIFGNAIKNTLKTSYYSADNHLEIILWNKDKTKKLLDFNVDAGKIASDLSNNFYKYFS